MNSRIRAVRVAALVALILPAAAFGAGFGIFEIGSKATALGGAFTATADDPSAMFYNPAGLGFLTRYDAYVGTTLIAPTSEFTGTAPYPGPEAKGEQRKNVFFPFGLHYAHPISEHWVAGVAVFTPAGLGTEWDHFATWSGRFVSQAADLQAVSIQPTLAWKMNDRFSVGLGAEYRTATVKLQKNIAAVNPYTQEVDDIAHVVLRSEGINAAWGFAIGMLYKVTDDIRLGASYRHHVDVDLDGTARFYQRETGYADFDAAVAETLPFGEAMDVKTSLAFPAQASIGAAWDVRKDITVEANANWTGWNRFEKLDMTFVDRADLSNSTPENYRNVWNFRLGIEKRYGQEAFRVGFVYDNTPQPNATVSPLLPDADRAGYSIGWGHLGESWGVDLAYMYLDFRNSSTRGESTAGFNGRYKETAHLLGVHARYRF